MKRIHRVFSVMLVVIMTFALLATPASASSEKSVDEEPMYRSYNYTKYKNENISISAPAAYNVSSVLDSTTIGTSITNPVDIYVDKNNYLYIVDQKQNKIVWLDEKSNLICEITTFDNNGTIENFSAPTSVCVKNEKIYIADSGNRRIVILNSDLSLNTILVRPVSDVLPTDLVFTPQKIDVDNNGRIFVIINGVYEGVMQLYEDNTFGGFIGQIPVDANPLTVLWRNLMTKEQRSKLQNTIPVEYTNISVTDDGFIYAVAIQSESADPISLLNSKGDNILNNSSLGDMPIAGDLEVEETAFTDICCDENGIFYALDSTSGRVFAYDNLGNMIYMFGGVDSEQNGTFLSASAIALRDGKICVADAQRGTITNFKQTEYTQDIINAIKLYELEDYEGSIKAWKEVLKYNNNYTLAYSKIGSALYRLGEYDEAMGYFKLASDQKNYSKAFDKYRTNLFQSNFTLFVLGIIVLLAIIIAIFRVISVLRRKHPAAKGGNREALEYPLYLICHPFDAFWDLKYEKRGRTWIATILVILTIFSFAIERGLTGFSLIANPDHQVDVIFELKFVLVPLLLFIIGNASVTTLLNGKGTVKQIYTAIGYALTPIVLTKIPLTIISNFLTLNEQSFYILISLITYIWTAILVFAALSCTHEYTAGQTVAIILLTIVAMLIICFVCVLFFSLITEIYGLCYSLFKEFQINFR